MSRGSDGIYRHPKSYPIPDIDLLTLCFESRYSGSVEDSVLHASAATPSIFLNKAGLRRLIEEFAYGLRKRFSIGASGPSKDVVVLFSSGQTAYPAAFFGIIAAGGIASMASPSSTAHELATQIRSGGANVLICSEDFLEIARAAVRQIEKGVAIVVLRSEPNYSLCIDRLDSDSGELRGQTMQERLTWERITDPKRLKESVIILLYSSGTTGAPKGVMLSHQNFVSQLIIVSSPSREFMAKEIANGFVPPPFRTIAHLPAAHIAGVMSYLVVPAFSGGTVFWIPKYTWPDFLRLNKLLRITSFYTVPSIYLRIAKDPAVTDQFRSLLHASAGAAPMDAALQRAANRRIGAGATRISQAWGLSETTGAVTAMARGSAPDDSGSISPVLPNMEMRFVDEHDRDVAVGTPGEILVRGPIVFRGYHNDPGATRAAFRNGWFATGDLAVERGGKFYIVDRLKELIKYKGLQVAPAEIEGLLIEHPQILEAAVVGIPDESDASSEVPRAYVVRTPAAAGRPASEITADQVRRYIADRLAPYKQLRGGVVFLNELPRGTLGKILRKDLRERAAEEIKRERGAKL